jgi:hypothetical protein
METHRQLKNTVSYIYRKDSFFAINLRLNYIIYNSIKNIDPGYLVWVINFMLYFVM